MLCDDAVHPRAAVWLRDAGAGKGRPRGGRPVRAADPLNTKKSVDGCKLSTDFLMVRLFYLFFDCYLRKRLTIAK